jgi:hypothetical protein
METMFFPSSPDNLVHRLFGKICGSTVILARLPDPHHPGSVLGVRVSALSSACFDFYNASRTALAEDRTPHQFRKMF